MLHVVMGCQESQFCVRLTLQKSEPKPQMTDLEIWEVSADQIVSLPETSS